MNWLGRLSGMRDTSDALVEALETAEQSRSELLDVVAKLEHVVSQLSSLPEVQITRRDRRKGGKTQ